MPLELDEAVYTCTRTGLDFGQGYGLLVYRKILTRYGPERSRENERISNHNLVREK